MPLPVAHAVRRAGTWAGEADRVTLDYAGRFLRRKRLATDAGAAFLVDLPETVSLAAGDAFETTDGALIAVVAAPEPLLEITGPDLVRLAWHVGNRHAPAEIAPGRILIRRDHVLADMLARLGASLRAIEAPFSPEGGAYGRGRTHGHHAGGPTDPPHDHDHLHEHGHPHAATRA